MNSKQLQSKMGSALGISLSKIRGSGIQLDSSTSNSKILSQMVKYDFVNMYPTSITRVNIKPISGTGYYVGKDYPFEINKIHADDLIVTSTCDFSKVMAQQDKIINSHRHSNIFAAEYDRLEKLYKHHNCLNDNEVASRFFKQLKNLGEEHPEWLI